MANKLIDSAGLLRYTSKTKEYVSSNYAPIIHSHIKSDVVSWVGPFGSATSTVNGTTGFVPAPSSGNQSSFLRGDGTWAEVSTKKEVGYVTSEPTSSSVSSLDNESIIFYETTGSGSSIQTPVYITGNQTVEGVKRFASGLYGNVISTTSNAFDVTSATCFVKTVTANATLSFTNVPTDVICCITVVLINGGSKTITWPSSVKWTNNTAPDLTSSGKDVFTFVTYDGGTTWFGTPTCTGVTA